MSKQSRGEVNAYLFLNLVVVGAFFIVLFTGKGKGILDDTIKWSTIFLVLVLVNSILLFKDVLTGKLGIKPVKSKSKKKKNNSLLPLRAILRNNDVADSELPSKVISKLHELSGVLRVELYTVEKRKSETVAVAGEAVPALNGARFIIKDENLTLVYSGSLGEEIIERADKQTPTEFKSSVSNLIMTVLPLNYSGVNQFEKLGVCLFVGTAEKPKPFISLSTAALYLETLMNLYDGIKLNKNLEYLDRETGIMVYSTFKEALQTELERSERYKQNMTLATIRIEGFDKLSEENARQVHRATGAEIKQIVRRFDRLFLGEKGGEYYAILTEADEKLAENIVGRLIKLFTKLKGKFAFEGASNLVMKTGTATYPTDASMVEGLTELSKENSFKSEKNINNGAKK